jgi:hypothetical protein
MFKTEQLLVNCFKKKHVKTFLERVFPEGKEISFTAIDEYKSSFSGIPDLVIGIPRLEQIEARPPLDINHVVYLPNIPINSRLTVKEFAEKYRVSLTTARNCIKSFVNSGFFEPSENHSFLKVKEYIPAFQKIVGIEAKLKNWQRALTQAYRYKHFSNCVYVVLDEHYARPAIKAIDEFKRFNVGLVSISEAELTVHFTSKENDPFKSAPFIRASEAILANCFQANQETISFCSI